jgi:hypothetical protein
MGAMPQIATLIADETSESSPIKAASIDSMIDEKLREDGFYRICPSHSHISQKMTLSLINRANIILVQKQKGGVKIRRGVMTVWSGPTDNSTQTYTASDCRYEWETVITT